jgi:hypothetical protein
MRSDREAKNELVTIPYPIKSNRYSIFWWNRNYQYCYEENEAILLQRIQAEYKALPETSKREDYFGLVDEKQWHDMWHCKKPTTTPARMGIEARSFTLPSREAKDAKRYPLWNYADSMARQVANWQGERIKSQDLDLMNDPAMLVFEELKYWLFDELSQKECKIEDRDYIARRQSYIKNLIHLLPGFGPDRVYLHEIQKNLEQASKIVFSCVANKELPHLLSDLISSEKSLESAMGTYLHFLLIDEDVAENFSPDFIQEGRRNCGLSPVCKIYKKADELMQLDQKQESVVEGFQETNKFYQLEKISENNIETRVQVKLKSSVLDGIKFASFVKEQDKNKYLEALATLESLVNVRSVLEKFQNILPQIGTYMFAVNYLENVDLLATNYINLVNKAKFLLNGLIVAADEGLDEVLSQNRYGIKNKFFEKNLRALETRVAEKTTVKVQLESYSKSAIQSMNHYQQEMKKLVTHLNSGEAAHEIEAAMQGVFVDMRQLNLFIPALLSGNNAVIIPKLDIAPPVKAIEPPAVNFEPDYLQHSGAEKRYSNWLQTIIGVSGLAKKMLDSTYQMITSSYHLPSLDHQSKTEAPYALKLITATSDTPLPMNPIKDSNVEPILIGRKAESSFTQPLSMLDKLTVARYVTHYAKKYLFTMPWDRDHVLTSEQITELKANQKVLQELSKTFSLQKNSAAAKSKLFEDQYTFVEKNLLMLTNSYQKTLTMNKVSKAAFSEMNGQLLRIQEIMHTLSAENRAIKKLNVKERRYGFYTSAGRSTIAITKHDVVTHDLQRKFIK